MDPVTQGVFGASWALSAQKKIIQRPLIKRALVLGLLSGMAADLDILIRSENDPLMYLEFHRQFTHSLIFIPLGALLCCFVLRKVLSFFKCFPQGENLKQDYFICLMGYASHGFLDAMTSYGTQLLWPFTNTRVSWDLISIIDPIFTSMLILGLILSMIKSKIIYARIFLAACFIYFGLGFIQQSRVMTEVNLLAKSRGHIPERLTVKPSFANILLWKSVYSYEGTYYVDAIRAGIKKKVYPGQTTKDYSLEEVQALAVNSPIQKNDVKRFHWFSQGYISIDDQNPMYVIDVRYSMLPNEVKALWGILLTPGANEHTPFIQTRDRSKEVRKKLMRMIRGE